MEDQCNSLKRSGERGRNRTYNLLIKSQLLCQLSYAPELLIVSTFGRSIGLRLVSFTELSPTVLVSFTTESLCI
jgi:hypothetical protein